MRAILLTATAENVTIDESEVDTAVVIKYCGAKTPRCTHGEEAPRAVRRSRQPDTNRPGVPYSPPYRRACGNRRVWRWLRATT